MMRSKAIGRLPVFWLAVFSSAVAWLAGDGTPLAEAKPSGVERKAWLTGPAVEQELRRPISVSWLRTPLRRALDSLSRSSGVAIFLDRRIDPTQPVELTLADEPLESALKKIAAKQHLGFSQIGPVAYFGPVAAAERMRTVAAMRREEAGQLPSGQRQALLQSRSLKWQRLATPREVFSKLAKDGGIKIEGLQAVPHDLWPEVDLPPMIWCDRITLLAAEFDLTFEIASSGDAVRLVPIPDHNTIRRSYRAGARAAELARRFSEQLPGATLRADGQSLVVEGRFEDHQAVQRTLEGVHPKPTKTVAAGKKVYTLSAERIALDKLLADLAKKLNLEIEYDPAVDEAGILRAQLVSFKVKEASLEELFAAALTPAGLTCRIKDRHVHIEPIGRQKP